MSHGDAFLYFNQISGSLIRVNHKTKKRIENVFTTSNTQNLQKKLYELGFLIDEDRDEFQEMHAAFQQRKNNPRTKSLAVTVTDQCNLACGYCYEEKKEWKKMDRSVQDDLIKFSDRFLESPTDELSITWYGGEPTLNMKAVKRLASYFREKAAKRFFSLQQFMITNGTNLTKNICQILLENEIRDLQITVDGNRKNHDVSRPFLKDIDYASASDIHKRQYEKLKKQTALQILDQTPQKKKTSSFDKIYEGLTRFVGMGGNVSLRMNVHEHSFDTIFETFHKLLRDGMLLPNKNGGCVFAYAHPIFESDNYTSGCNGCPTAAMSQSRFAERVDEIRQWHHHHGIPYKDSSAQMSFSGGTCIANQKYGYVVNPDGSLTKCTHDIARPDKVVGHINDVYDFDDHPLPDTGRVHDFDPFEDEECSKCEILPLCCGGCKIVNDVGSRNTSYENGCSTTRFNFEDDIRHMYSVQKMSNPV